MYDLRKRLSLFLAAGAVVLGVWAVACTERGEQGGLVRKDEPGYNRLDRCVACHTNTLTEWRKSLHSLAMTVPSDSTVVGDFNNAVHAYGGVISRMFRRNGDFYMETRGPEGKQQTYRVDYTIGVRQHQAYLTRFPNGGYQVLPLYHDGATGTWVDAQEGGVVAQRTPLSETDYYFWTNPGRTWDFHCFDCHASRVKKQFDVALGTYESSVGSLTIDCEACHGPCEKHDLTRGKPGEPLHLMELQRLSKEQGVEVCAQCHAAKEILAVGYQPGDRFYDYYQLALPNESALFYPDGQPRVYIYPAVLHLMGSCYLNDDLRCTSCHDSHGSDRPVDLVADREGVGLCEGCHAEIAADPVKHGHHKPGSAGNQCVQCHMPYHYVTGENLTDHRILSPVPQNTVELGIPNACGQTDCHADQSAQWASEWSEKWYGNYQDAEVKRAQAVAWGRQGDARGLEPMMAMLTDASESPVWRATAATLLGKIGAPRAVGALLQGLTAPHPMVRTRSAKALGTLGDLRAVPGLLRALADSSLSVRIVAPFALMDMGYFPDDDSETGSRFRQALIEHRTVVEGVQADDPGFHESLGQVYERQGRYETAKLEYQIVARLDPQHPETAADLKRLQENQGVFKKTGAMLQSALAAQPEDSYLRAQLGALLLAHGRTRAAAEVLEAVGDGVHSEAFFLALGDARLETGDRAGALAAYQKVLIQTPGHRGAVRRVALLAFTAEGATVPDAAEGMGQAWLDRGVAQTIAGHFGAAQQAFGLALQFEAEWQAPETPVPCGLGRQASRAVSGLAKETFEAGMAAYRVGQIDTALAAFQKAIPLDPEQALPRAMAGLILADQGDLAAAETMLQTALLIDPSYVSAYTILGTVYQEQEQLDRAMQTYRQAWRLNPKAPGLESFMGQVYLLQGARDSARAVLERVVAREPGNVQAREMLLEVKTEMGGL